MGYCPATSQVNAQFSAVTNPFDAGTQESKNLFERFAHDPSLFDKQDHRCKTAASKTQVLEGTYSYDDPATSATVTDNACAVDDDEATRGQPCGHDDNTKYPSAVQ